MSGQVITYKPKSGRMVNGRMSNIELARADVPVVAVEIGKLLDRWAGKVGEA